MKRILVLLSVLGYISVICSTAWATTFYGLTYENSWAFNEFNPSTGEITTISTLSGISGGGAIGRTVLDPSSEIYYFWGSDFSSNDRYYGIIFELNDKRNRDPDRICITADTLSSNLRYTPTY